VIAALLADGIERAGKGEQWLQKIVQRMQLIQGLAESELKTRKAEVIYLDPMFPEQQNSKLAKVKKAMQLLRGIPGTASNEKNLLAAACTAANERVVVKRPNWAPFMAELEPAFQVPGKNYRYDVYKT